MHTCFLSTAYPSTVCQSHYKLLSIWFVTFLWGQAPTYLQERSEPICCEVSCGDRYACAMQYANFLALFNKKVCEHCRAASISSLMYVKEDLIIPHNISFYDLISSKARGKSGPLFHFDVHEDIRLQNDARVEKDESHAGVPSPFTAWFTLMFLADDCACPRSRKEAAVFPSQHRQ